MQRALLFSLIAASYLLLAGGPRWTLTALAGLAALGIAVSPRRTLRSPASRRSLDLALLATATGMAVQMVPLPSGVVAWLSPLARPVRESLNFALGESTAWLPLSIDAEATAYALANLTLGVAAFWIARTTFSSGGIRQFCRILGFLAAVAAIVAIVQREAAPRLLMGLVAAEERNANPMGPFLNRNHFGAWLLMTSSITMGYITAHLHVHSAYRLRFLAAFKHFVTSGTLLSGLGVLAMIAALLMTLSRSAAVGLGAAAVFAGWIGRSRLRVERNSLPALATLAGVAILLVAAFIDLEGWFTRLQHSVGAADEGAGRLTIWRESLPIIRDFVVTGTGAGTYSDAMGRYQQTRIWVGAMQNWAHFNNAHSHYVQLAAEGGLLLTVPVMTAVAILGRLGLAAIRADKGEMFWVRVGAAAGLMGIAVQSIWEVSLVMPANTILCGVLAGLLLHRRDAAGRPVAAESPLTPDDTPGRT